MGIQKYKLYECIKAQACGWPVRSWKQGANEILGNNYRVATSDNFFATILKLTKRTYTYLRKSSLLKIIS